MCRHLAYLGPPIPLSRLVFEPPHSLARQSWAPRDMRGGGTINADGFGLGWFPIDAKTPLRYRREHPLWTDADLPARAAATVSGAFLAAVRSATVGMPVTATAAAPFLAERWLFSHNGRVSGWPESVAPLAATLPVTDLLTLDAPTDSALLWALVRHRLRTGSTVDDVLRSVTRDVLAVAPGSRLNLLLTDGATLAATACGHALSYLSPASPASPASPVDTQAVTVASEPLDGGPWRAVPDGSLLVVKASTASTVDISPMEGVAP